jgi:hypothetical protein
MRYVFYEKCRIMTNVFMRNVFMRNVFMRTVVMTNTVAPISLAFTSYVKEISMARYNFTSNPISSLKPSYFTFNRLFRYQGNVFDDIFETSHRGDLSSLRKFGVDRNFEFLYSTLFQKNLDWEIKGLIELFRLAWARHNPNLRLYELKQSHLNFNFE